MKIFINLCHYSLFSITRDADIILALYAENRYELEVKYTSMIDLGSRPTLPRVDMTPLADFLNVIENKKREETASSAEYDEGFTLVQHITEGLEEREGTADIDCEIFKWQCDRITDSGPILRLNSNINKLSKAARYGHPYERPIYPSLIAPTEMKRIVTSFFSHAYQTETGGVVAKMDHEWSELHDFNKNIDWSSWSHEQLNESSTPSRHI
jgi:hypothetical protein